ncbi:MAG: sodium-dependent transporter [Desulfovibrionaceae bacterium]|nr:sodium-dependent transporter [Desulfovibrionaceae bacterium]
MRIRETFSSRLGFILLSAGCAIGLGNVWRFPYVTGKCGGAFFLFTYLGMLLLIGLPILIIEFSIGRGSGLSMGKAMRKLSPSYSFWHHFGPISIIGSYLLMMFYVPITGWIFSYCLQMMSGSLFSLSTAEVSQCFTDMLKDPLSMYGWTALSVIIGFSICAAGLRNGIERVVKILMIVLLGIMILLMMRALFLPGAGEALKFYLAPNWEQVQKIGIGTLLSEAMNQAFFTLSIGIGSMLIFGSYLNKTQTLTGEASLVVGLDTLIALIAGAIIFPVCFSFGVQPDAGPSLLFITLPNMFREMNGGLFWGSAFFICMLFAALTTVIAVFENIVSYCIDVFQWSRTKSTVCNALLMLILVLPCILGFNVWSGFEPLGSGTNIMDLEDFCISNNILPGGALLLVLFCTSRKGWGFHNFIREADTGRGPKFPSFLRPYLSSVLPFLILFLIFQGYMRYFS